MKKFANAGSIKLDDNLEMEVHSIVGKQTVHVRLTRIGAQQLADALNAYAGATTDKSFHSAVTRLGVHDLTPPATDESNPGPARGLNLTRSSK